MMSIRSSVGSYLRSPEAKLLSIDAFQMARSTLYQIEGLMAPAIELWLTRKRPRMITDDPKLFRAARQSLRKLLKEDSRRIVEGLYPVSVLKPDRPLTHLRRLPKMFTEGIEIARRRKEKLAHEFSAQARELLPEMPEYYQRCFHFQGDGYLSDRSAELYEHQVDVLFAGASDAMRRLVILPLRERFGPSDGEGLTFLELGAGTGRATQFVRLAFPRAKIVAVDLSAPYLKRAQRALTDFPRHDFLEANASQLPIKDHTFDAVYSVFLFHELPATERTAVMQETARVLKPGGLAIAVDSLQAGDDPNMDMALERFPLDFHEPFYREYTKASLARLLSSTGFHNLGETHGFLAKCVWAETKMI